MSLELGPQAIGWIVQTGVVALVGFLLKRGITGLDESIRDVKASLKALDMTDREQGRAILELNIQVKYLQAENRELKDELKRTQDRHEEFGKFLSWKFNFKRSTDPMPEGGP